MKNKISKALKLIPSIGAVAVSFLPLISLAAAAQPININGDKSIVVQSPPAADTIDFGKVAGAFCSFINWFFTILTVLVVIYVLVAAYNYISSGGDEEKVKKANHQLLYAGIGLAVALLSKALPRLVVMAFGGDLTGC